MGKTPIYDCLPYAILFMVDVITGEYVDIFNYLFLHQFPNGVSKNKKTKKIIPKTSPYIAIRKTLYKSEKDGLLQHCVMQVKVSIVLEGCHADVYGRHFVDPAIGSKILMVRYWWPSLFKDLFNWVKHCDACQQVGKHLKFNQCFWCQFYLKHHLKNGTLILLGPSHQP